MMPKSSKKSSKVPPAQKTKKLPAPASRPDVRLADAEKFLLPTYKRQPVIMTHGRGAYVFDSTGKKYLDFLGGIAVNALGHAHPRIVKVIRREAVRHSSFQPLSQRISGPACPQAGGMVRPRPRVLR